MASDIPRNGNYISPVESHGNSNENHGRRIPQADTQTAEMPRNKSWTGYNEHSKRCSVCKKPIRSQPQRRACQCPSSVRQEMCPPGNPTTSANSVSQTTNTNPPGLLMGYQAYGPLANDTNGQWAEFTSQVIGSLSAQLAAQGSSASPPAVYFVIQNNMQVVGDSVTIKTGTDNSYVDNSHGHFFLAKDNASMNVRSGSSSPP